MAATVGAWGSKAETVVGTGRVGGGIRGKEVACRLLLGLFVQPTLEASFSSLEPRPQDILCTVALEVGSLLRLL